MCSTGLLFSATTVVVLLAHLGEGAAQRSGSLRTSPSVYELDTHAPHPGEVTRHKHTADAALDSHAADEFSVADAGLELYGEAGASHAAQPAMVAPVLIDNVTTTTPAPVASGSESAVTGLPGQLPGNDGQFTSPEPTTPEPSAAQSTTTGGMTTPEPASEGANATTMDPAATPPNISTDAASTEDPAAGNATGDPAAGNATGVGGNSTEAAGNSTAGKSNSTVAEDRGQEYGDAAQAHDDMVVGGGQAASGTVTVSAGEGQGSGVSAFVVGLIIILSLIAVALVLGSRL